MSLSEARPFPQCIRCNALLLPIVPNIQGVPDEVQYISLCPQCGRRYEATYRRIDLMLVEVNGEASASIEICKHCYELYRADERHICPSPAS